MASSTPKKWLLWLPLAEFWYNTNYHTSLKATPFKALYGYDPPSYSLDPYLETTDTDASILIQQRQLMTETLKENLVQAQNRMKQIADKGRSERSFEVGDLVYLKLQPFRQNSVALRRNLKLASRYYGPFPVLERIGQVAYRLDLPSESRIHPVFHVSLLKKSISPRIVPSTTLPLANSEGIFSITPVAILDTRLISRKGAKWEQLLIDWGSSLSYWEDGGVVRSHFKNLDPRGQGSQSPGGIVISQK